MKWSFICSNCTIQPSLYIPYYSLPSVHFVVPFWSVNTNWMFVISNLLEIFSDTCVTDTILGRKVTVTRSNRNLELAALGWSWGVVYCSGHFATDLVFIKYRVSLVIVVWRKYWRTLASFLSCWFSMLTLTVQCWVAISVCVSVFGTCYLCVRWHRLTRFHVVTHLEKKHVFQGRCLCTQRVGTLLCLGPVLMSTEQPNFAQW